MFSARNKLNWGVAASVGALTVFVIAVFLIHWQIVSPVLERERAALSKTLNLEQMITRTRSSDEATRAELASYVVVLRDGGKFTALDGNSHELAASGSEELIAAVNAVEEALGRDQGSDLGELTNNVAIAQYKAWDSLNAKVRWYRYALVLATILLLGFVAVQLYHRSNRSKILWNAMLEDNKSILEAASDGLLLITPSLQIGETQSTAVKTLFGVDEPPRGDFFEFLKFLIGVEDLTAARKYVSEVLADSDAPSSMSEVNPLKEVKVTINGKRDAKSIKYLSFTFIKNTDDPDAGVLVTIRDVTNEVQLRNQLHSSSDGDEERFFSLMGSIIDKPAEALKFQQGTQKSMSQIDTLLNELPNDLEGRQKNLQAVLTVAGRLKADASSAGVDLIERSAAQFEASLSKLLKRGGEQNQVSAEHVRSLLAPVIREQALFGQLLEKLKSAELSAGNAESNPVSTIPRSGAPVALVESGPAGFDGSGRVAVLATQSGTPCRLERIANKVAAQHEKMVKLERVGFENFSISSASERQIDELCSHLVANSVTHGIELPQIRRDQGKPSEGRILVSLRDNDHQTVLLRVWDDGQGFNFDAIRKTAVERGMVSADVVGDMSKSELVRFIFVSGFSTDDSSEDIGQGLDVVKSSVVKLGGKISVRSSRGRSAQVTIELPLAALALVEESLPESLSV